MSKRRLLVLAVFALVLASPATARADTVTEWNTNASNALFNVAGQPPNVGVLHMAMVQGAVYDAVNAIDRKYQSYIYFTNRVQPRASKEAAAATAAYRVLVSIVPAQQPAIEQLYLASIAALPSAGKSAGIAYGEEAAAAMIANRMNDGRFGPPGFPVGTAPGQWRPTLPSFVNDPNGWVRYVRPFLVKSSAQFRSAGPFPLTSAAYAAEFNEVKMVGALNSATRTMFQTNASNYWAESPIRTWNRILRNLSAQAGLSIEQNARLFAMFTLTQADSVITVWDEKAYWSFWRPITAIREADLDGNPATTADPTWLPLIANPPYSDHASGASCLAGAAARTLQQFFGTDSMSWTDTNVGGFTRSFTSFSAARDEVVSARVWSGIHFRRADVAGATIGQQVAEWREAHYFRPGRGF